MAISNVKKLGVVVLREKKDELIRFLHKFGFVEIIRPEKNDSVNLERLQELNQELAELENALSHTSQYVSGGGLKSMLAGRKELTLRDLSFEADRFEKDIVTKISDLKNEIKELENSISNSKSEISKYMPWNFTEISVGDIERLNLTSAYYLSGKTEMFSDLKTLLKKNDIPYEICVHSDKNSAKAILFYLKDHNEKVFSLVSESGASIEEPGIKQSTASYIESHRNKIEENERNIINCENTIKRLSEHHEKMKLYTDHLSILKDELEAENNFMYTRHTAFVKIWIPEDKIGFLKENLEKDLKFIQITEMALDENEKPPVILEGNSFTSPFQSITTMYGTPGKGEFDPTPWFAPFFVLFFGFCLSDAGYGFVVALLAISGLFVKDIDQDIKKGLKLMVYCGFSTIVMGALFGSWFGWTPPTNSFLGSFKKIDPNADALLLMKISLLLGAIQIVWSKILSAVKAFLNRDLAQTTEEVIWAVYLVSFFMSAARYVGFVAGESWYYSFFGGMAGTIVIINIIRSKANILIRPFQSILKLYDTIGFFGDALSYSRLMALALATGGVALAINVVADLAMTLVPVPGVNFFIKVLILVFGHSFNIIINVLGSFIHSMRLQFVEFFQKFFDGGGSLFKPFRLNTKYVRLVK